MATINFDIPDAEAMTLLQSMAKKYQGLTIPATKAEKEALLTKLIQRDIVKSMAQMIIEEKQQEAVNIIKATPYLTEDPLEAELKLVAPVEQ